MREDIQALRGVAVLLVLFHHAQIGPFSAGYLGVDIFFVISGFLITGMVKKAIEQQRFSFSEFYFRRAKRLLPAAYVTFLATAVLAPFFLNTLEMSEFVAQLLGALSFTGNIVLWQQVGYFDGAAELKPLLHVWSLSIEEQYYLLLPACMVFVRPRFWLPGAMVVLFVSLVLCLVMQPLRPDATFYLLPTRAWELALGSVVALAVLEARPWVVRWSRPLFLLGLGVVILVPLFPFSVAHPGIDAILVCLGTLLVIASNRGGLQQSLLVRATARVGDVSYSLYLVHWPMFAYLNNAYVTHPDWMARFLVLVASLLVAFGLHRLVEEPVRRMDVRRLREMGFVKITIAASLSLAILPLGLVRADAPSQDFASIRRANVGLDEACDFAHLFSPLDECMSAKEPGIMVWGDSYAMHLVAGIAANTAEGVVQATRTACGPVLGLAFVRPPKYSDQWARSCVEFNRSVMDYLEQTDSIQTVILSSPFHQFLPQRRPTDTTRSFYSEQGVGREQAPDVARSSRYFAGTIARVRGLGKNIVIVAPPPAGRFNAGDCLERKARGKIILGVGDDCAIPRPDFINKRGAVLDWLSDIGRMTGVPIARMDEVLCDASSCRTRFDGVLLYRDGTHLTYDGSKLLSKLMDWPDSFKRLAH